MADVSSLEVPTHWKSTIALPQRSDQDSNNIVKLQNPNLKNIKGDNLYHLALSTATHNHKEMFGDVKFVCMGGTPSRMQRFTQFVKKGLGIHLPTGAELYDISEASHRYCMYKIGPVLSVSHGMGSPSLSIVMHELLKLLHYSQCTQDVVMLRLGTCGGIGVPSGSVVVSTAVMNGLLQEELEVFVLGECVRRFCVLDGDLVRELVDVGNRFLPAMNIVRGKTLSTDDFYEGQGRLDGAFCTYTEKSKHQFMEKLRSMGVRNIEMEAAQFAAMCHFAGLKGGVVCVALLDRLEGDQVDVPDYDMIEWQERPQELALQFIRNRLGLPPKTNKYLV
ncbi:uridine phosphorylase 1-like [Rhipicephalus microplus]|uniref:uridine phosphorylase 1-like n=1 Tax=Rhipicephalus microplus TaxID=6941 RepID=UPI003F6CCD25